MITIGPGRSWCRRLAASLCCHWSNRQRKGFQLGCCIEQQDARFEAHPDDAGDPVQEDVGAGDAVPDQALPQHLALQVRPRISRHHLEPLPLLRS